MEEGDTLITDAMRLQLSLVVSLLASFVLSFFPLDVLDEIWDVIESISEGFLTYAYSVLLFLFFLPSSPLIPYITII